MAGGSSIAHLAARKSEHQAGSCGRCAARRSGLFDGQQVSCVVSRSIAYLSSICLEHRTCCPVPSPYLDGHGQSQGRRNTERQCTYCTTTDLTLACVSTSSIVRAGSRAWRTGVKYRGRGGLQAAGLLKLRSKRGGKEAGIDRAVDIGLWTSGLPRVSDLTRRARAHRRRSGISRAHKEVVS